MTIRRVLQLILLFGFTLLLASCSLAKRSPVDGDQRFCLAIMDRDLDSTMPALGYELETSWPVLQKAFPSEVVSCITEDDMEAYDWTNQTITLSVTATTRLIDMFECPIEFGSGSLYLCLDDWGFVVALDDEMIYGGILTMPGSAMAIRFPVIFPTLEGDKAVLTIRPRIRYTEGEDWHGIKDTKIETFFEQLGKLTR